MALKRYVFVAAGKVTASEGPSSILVPVGTLLKGRIDVVCDSATMDAHSGPATVYGRILNVRVPAGSVTAMLPISEKHVETLSFGPEKIELDGSAGYRITVNRDGVLAQTRVFFSMLGNKLRLNPIYFNGTTQPGCPLSAYFSSVAVEAVAELWSVEDEPTEQPPPVVVTPAEPPPGPVPAMSEPIDLAKARIIGKHVMDPTKARIVSVMHSAEIFDGKVRIDYSPDTGWPVKADPKKPTDGGMIILWQDGDGYVGGWYDHHGVNQKVKTLANIPGGYIDGREPPRGARVWFYNISYSGTERTSVVEASNRWQ